MRPHFRDLDIEQLPALFRAAGRKRPACGNETGADYRTPTWAEVKDFTERLRRLPCPVKIRYSGGKLEGMGCGQLAGSIAAR